MKKISSISYSFANQVGMVEHKLIQKLFTEQRFFQSDRNETRGVYLELYKKELLEEPQYVMRKIAG